MKVGEGSHETKRDRGKGEKCCQQKRAPVAQQAADISWTAVICDDVTNQLDAGRCVTRRFGRRRTALGGPPAGQRPSRTRSRRRSTPDGAGGRQQPLSLDGEERGDLLAVYTTLLGRLLDSKTTFESDMATPSVPMTRCLLVSVLLGSASWALDSPDALRLSPQACLRAALARAVQWRKASRWASSAAGRTAQGPAERRLAGKERTPA